jgi:Tol biopolymer transport system component
VLASVVMFRDGKTPFSDDDAEALKAISPIFATALATMVHEGDDGSDEDGSLLDEDVRDENDNEPKKKKRKPQNDADWWKRGEDPPF